MAKFEFSEWLSAWLDRQATFSFDWDSGNQTKSETKHAVEFVQAEEVFSDHNFIPLGLQTEPLVTEPRFGILGQSLSGVKLHVVFTLRKGKIRIISARPMHRKERSIYAKIIRQE